VLQVTEIVGTLATARVASSEKFRVTWTRAFAKLLPAFTFDAPKVANDIRNWLPSAGFVPVSNPSAKSGDEVVVFDVRLASQWGGKTVADVLVALNEEPHAMDVTRLEKIPLTATSTQLEQGQSDAVSEGNRDASFDDLLASFGATLKTAGGVVAIVLVVGAVAFVVYKSRK